MCPPNIKIDETYQEKNLDEIIKNSSENFEDDYLKKKFPNLANIIFDQTGKHS
jgi:hypothetical protein